MKSMTFLCRMMVLLPLLFATVFLPSSANAQEGTRTVSGIVYDETSSPLIGAFVIAQGTTTGTATDVDGKFNLSVPKNVKNLEISYVGYSKEIVAITSDGNVTVTLKPNTLIDEVVVIGYGTQKKEDLTGSIATVGEKDFN